MSEWLGVMLNRHLDRLDYFVAMPLVQVIDHMRRIIRI
jgi:hypothetical protein